MLQAFFDMIISTISQASKNKGEIEEHGLIRARITKKR